MRLGDHFLQPASARQAPVKHVKLKLIGRSPATGEPMTADADATMVFIDEKDRQEAIRDAHKAMTSLYGSAAIPAGRLEEEITYQVLHRCLRDPGSEYYRVSFAQSVEELKRALTYKVAADLDQQYNNWVDLEFPSSITQEDFENLVKEAEGKSLAVLLQSFGYSRIRGALASLALKFGGRATQT